MDVNVLVLAAGQSERMGSDKALLFFNESRTFIEQQIIQYDRLKPEQIVVVANPENQEGISKIITDNNFQVELHINEIKGSSKMYSILSGIKRFKSSNSLFIQNIDNPFIDITLLENLYKRSKKDYWVRPVFKQKGGHPILLGKELVKKLGTITDHKINFKDFIREFPGLDLPVYDKRVLANINSLEEYELHFKQDLG